MTGQRDFTGYSSPITYLHIGAVWELIARVIPEKTSFISQESYTFGRLQWEVMITPGANLKVPAQFTVVNDFAARAAFDPDAIRDIFPFTGRSCIESSCSLILHIFQAAKEPAARSKRPVH
jgi:hypothetical protein